MTQYAFGIGVLIGKRTDVTGQPPALFGTISDCTVDFDRKVETLRGQYNAPVALGGADFRIYGKAKNAQFQATTLNNMFLGPNASTTTIGSMLELANAERRAVPASAAFTISVSSAAGWTNDLGVFYTSNGNQLAPTSGTPTAGQYSVASGVYTFPSTDAGAGVNIYYNYTTTVSGASQISLTNSLMGPIPSFQLNFKESFNYFGANKNLVIQLNQCFCPKLSWPFNNSKFAMQDFDWEAVADAANNLGTISLTE